MHSLFGLVVVGKEHAIMANTAIDCSLFLNLN